MNKSQFKNKTIDKTFYDHLDNLKGIYSEDDLSQLKAVYEQLEASRGAKAKLIRKIVPIKEWIDDSYYVGPDTTRLYPYWKDLLIEIFDRSPDEPKINQVILTGSLGGGKTTAAMLIIIRKIYELSCYKNISALFNLLNVSRIAFAYLSVTKEQAQQSGFALLQEWIDSIPYFNEHFPRKKPLDSLLVWPQERMFVTVGSVANHFIGLNLIGSVLDEANFFHGRALEDADETMNTKVAALYNQIINRSLTRFVINDVNHSLSILVSSAATTSSFTNERILAAQGDPHTIIKSPAIWEVKPWEFSDNRFYVFAGDKSLAPFIINSIEDMNTLFLAAGATPVYNISMDEAYTMLPSLMKDLVLKVPTSLKQGFQGDIALALQDLAGYSVAAANKLFTAHDVYNKAVNTTRSHPFSSEHIVLSTSRNIGDEGFLPIKSYLKPGFKFDNPTLPRYVHLDLALSGDSAGIGISHISGWKNMYQQESNYEDLRHEDDIQDEIRIPKLQVDLMLRIKPPKKTAASHKISLSKIRDFLVYLRNELQLNIVLVTADQFQSAQLLQELAELNFKTAGLSVDRTPEAYLTLANLFYEERLDIYPYEPFREEFFSLIYYRAKKKVDHPNKGSKDVSDGVAGSIFSAVKDIDKADSRDSTEMAELFMQVNSSSDYSFKQEVEKVMRDLLGTSKPKY